MNRREVLKAGAIGAIFGFLFRGKRGELQEDPVEENQLPSAATVVCAPMVAFRPERLIIVGKVVGKEMVPDRIWRTCEKCVERDELEDGCEECNWEGGRMVETGEMRERNIYHVPWVLEDIQIGKKSQMVGEGGIPGDLFSFEAVDTNMMLDACGLGTEIRFRVRYTGDEIGGEQFRASLIGRTVDGEGSERMAVLPINSGCNIIR